MTPARLVAALAVLVALAHAPFVAQSLEDIDSVNFALGMRHFDIAQHRPHPPGYPIYIAVGKMAVGTLRAVSGAISESALQARAMAWLSILSAMAAVALLYRIFASLGSTRPDGAADPPWKRFDATALAAAAITMTCPLLWYLTARPMSDLPGFAALLLAQSCFLLAFWWQCPVNGDRRLTPDATAASGRMIVLGAFVAGLAVGVRTQTLWLTAPLLALVLVDRIGRGVAGALIGSAMTFTIGGLLWAVPLLVASGGLDAYLAALGSQAGDDLTSGTMLWLNPSARLAAFAVKQTFVDPWDSPALAAVVLVLASVGVVVLLGKDRRTFLALAAMGLPYFTFHVLFQDTSYVRYAAPLMPVVAYLAVRGARSLSGRLMPLAGAAISIWGVVIAAPVLAAYGAEPSPAARVAAALVAEARATPVATIAMHQTFRRPLEAESMPELPVLPSPPRREWLELVKYWKDAPAGALWFLADPQRTDLALVDRLARRDLTPVRWPLVDRLAFGGLRPVAVDWIRMTPPGWFAEEGWALTPETAGMARLMGKGPHLGPITAWVRRREGAVRILVGGRNLGATGGPAARFTLAIGGETVQTWDVAPGFFLRTVDLEAGRLAGEGRLVPLTIHSAPVSGQQPVQSAIEQFDLQANDELEWGFGEGWQEAEYAQTLGIWRWTSERATVRTFGAPGPLVVTIDAESPLRYFDKPTHVLALAGEREVAAATLDGSGPWRFEVPAEALAASGGAVTLVCDQTFVPAARGSAPDERRLGLRVFKIAVERAGLR